MDGKVFTEVMTQSRIYVNSKKLSSSAIHNYSATLHAVDNIIEYQNIKIFTVKMEVETSI